MKHSDLILNLSVVTAVGATRKAPLCFTKKKDMSCDPEMHSSKMGNISIDSDSELEDARRSACGQVSNLREFHTLLHGHENIVAGAARYHGIERRHFAKRNSLGKGNGARALIERFVMIKVSVWAKIEYSFGAIKRQCGFIKV